MRVSIIIEDILNNIVMARLTTMMVALLAVLEGFCEPWLVSGSLVCLLI